ncbi:hypothetical protein BJY16_008755 [Actinoplanes octamycinicus]|uniref:Knr4/Smi1-like domain-containing protein n=1 Tax=Actinoplanes octamycinicus TaxID=135948 RepID=A0A7W7H775_9ACTN|nr:hypothetical protein [Actinoplanes octamycinicus]MBB4745296.1 hypothetical protein [Actinoplanes octamycinicus]GIE62225.1 hypothetical protein Aoc01nite_76270 [Actinoplanes octamycinicus]
MTVDEAWVRRWRDAMVGLAERVPVGFQDHFGYPPDEHEIGDAATGRELAGLVGVPESLLVFHRVVGEVRLPDVHVGYWIHRPSLEGDFPHALSDGRRIVVFGSDGGGGMFALPRDADGPVLLLNGGAVVGGVHDADRIEFFAADLPAFLTFLRERTEENLRR